MWYMLYICDMSMMIWTGRSTEHGPKDQQSFGMEIPWDTWIGRSYRVMTWKGVCVVCGILGNSLSIYAYRLCVMCFRYQWWLRECVDMIHTHTWDLCNLILGNVFVKQRYDTMRFVNKCVWKMCFEKLKIVLIFTVLQIFYTITCKFVSLMLETRPW